MDPCAYLFESWSVCTETVKELSPYYRYFDLFEFASLLIFTFEYMVRVFISLQKGKALQYMLSFMGLIYMISVFPILFPLSGWSPVWRRS